MPVSDESLNSSEQCAVQIAIAILVSVCVRRGLIVLQDIFFSIIRPSFKGCEKKPWIYRMMCYYYESITGQYSHSTLILLIVWTCTKLIMICSFGFISSYHAMYTCITIMYENTKICFVVHTLFGYTDDSLIPERKVWFILLIQLGFKNTM